MRNNKRFYTSLILAVFILALLVTLPASFSDSNEATNINSINEVVDINSSGSVHISETIDYDFSDSYNTVVLDIPVTSPETISNIAIDSPGYENNATLSTNESTDRIIVQLSNNENNITSENVSVTYSYDYDYLLTRYNDVAVLDYLLWDNNWIQDVDVIDLQVNIPDDNSNIELWNNPPFYNNTPNWSNSTSLNMHYEANDIKDTLVLKLIMPSSYIDATGNVQVVDSDANQSIESQQADYQNTINNNNIRSYATIIISLILIITPMAFGWRYRNKNFDLDKYKNDPPEMENPILINRLATMDIDNIDINAFYTTILDLIDRNVLEVRKVNNLTPYLKVNMDQRSGLEEFESEIVDYLARYSDNDFNIKFNEMKKKDDHEKFQKFIEEWYEIANNKINSLIDFKDYYDDYRYRILHRYSLIVMVLAIILYIVVLRGMTPQVPSYSIARDLLVVLLIENFIVYMLQKSDLAIWTDKGHEFISRCRATGQLEDYEKFEENKPESLEVLKRDIVTLTALGKTKELLENMKKYFANNKSKESKYKEPVVYFVFTGLYKTMIDTFTELEKPYKEPEVEQEDDEDVDRRYRTITGEVIDEQDRDYNRKSNSEEDYTDQKQYEEDDEEEKKKKDEDFWDDFEYYHYFQE